MPDRSILGATARDAAAPVAMSRPRRPLPPNACDCHAHVFGPFDRFPLADGRTYTPPISSASLHRQMLERLGFSRGVVVQGSAHGFDNRCIVDAVDQSPRSLRGIGVVDSSVADFELADLRAHGVLGLRFTEIASARPSPTRKPVSGFEALQILGPRLREHDLHAQIFADCETFVAAAPRLLDLGVPLVLDHMAKIFPGARPVSDPAFQVLLGLLREGRIWVKLTIIRGSDQAPGYEDLRPLHDALLAANPKRLVWGTDWPLLNMGERTPDLGKLLDLFDAWTGDDALRQAILVDNPATLYGFESLELEN